MADMQAPSGKAIPTQKLVDITEVRDGVVIMKDGTLRAVLMVSSLNFALKSEEEQNAIVYAYQDFLNALEFPIQVLVSSRKADITPYLQNIRQRRDRQKNELLRLQMDEYANFVGELVKNSNIMTKTFFVIVPFAVTEGKKVGFASRFKKGVNDSRGKQNLTDEEFGYNRGQLFQRVEQVSVGLRALGLRIVPLQTNELVELFYTMYNPVTARNQRLKNIGELNVGETTEG